MTLIKTSILSFIATSVKIIAGLVINKAVAVYIGPAGLALIGQFQNFMQLIMTAAQGAINAGITKYLAEYGNDSDRIPVLLSSASKISFFTSIVVGLTLVIFSDFASIHFLKNEEYAYIFVIFGFTVVLFVVNNILLSALNGLKEIKLFISINIIQSIYSLVFTTILIFYLGLDGALIALVTNQSVVLGVVLFLLRKHPIIKAANFKRGIDKTEVKKLLSFSAMAIATAVTVPISHLIIREHIGQTLGWDKAGNWQAIWQISTAYLMVVTTTLSIYYLPRLSELKGKSELRAELLKGYKFILPIVLFMSVIVYMLKDYIVWLLYTDEFGSVQELFMWQLVGGVIKIAAWLLSYLMIAKAMTKLFIVLEVFFAAFFVITAVLLIDNYGLIGTSYAFALNYAFYLAALVFVLKNYLWQGDAK